MPAASSVLSVHSGDDLTSMGNSALESLAHKLTTKVRVPLGAGFWDASEYDAEVVGLSARYAEDVELLALAAKTPGPCSLDRNPGKSNWVEKNGGLPNYVCQIAKAVHRQGHSISQSIAIAIGTIKRWSVDPKKSASVRARAKAALAEWEAMKARAKAKRATSKD